MREGRTDSVDFDVFGIVNVDELLVDERTVRAGLVERVVVFGGLVADLRGEKTRDAKKEENEKGNLNVRYEDFL